jgi:hypothetical protein
LAALWEEMSTLGWMTRTPGQNRRRHRTEFRHVRSQARWAKCGRAKTMAQKKTKNQLREILTNSKMIIEIA